MATRATASTTEEVATTATATPVEIIETDDYGSVAYAPAPFTPINELLKQAHFENIPWARPDSIPFENKPINRSLWTGNSWYRLNVTMPKDCWFTSEAFVSPLLNKPYTVTGFTLEQAEIEIDNENLETEVNGKVVYTAQKRVVWHIVFRSTDANGKSHPVARLMWNVVEGRTQNAANNFALTGNMSWGVPAKLQIKGYEKTLIKRAIRAALNGETAFTIKKTNSSLADKTLIQLYHELFALNNNEGKDLPENLNRSVSEDVFGDQDTV